MEEIAYRQHRALEEAHWWFVGMRAIYAKQLAGLRLPPGSRLLDVGCGTGGTLQLLSSIGTTWAVDASPTAAAFVRGRGFPRITVGSATELPFEDGSFDVVTAFGVIEHVERDDLMLEEMLRVARPGGHTLILTSAHRWLWSVHDERVHHVRRYRRAELGERVARAGWQIEQLSYVNAALFPPVAAVRLLQRLLPRPKNDEHGMSGFGMPPGPLNRALAGLLALEGSFLEHMDLPMGVGLICRAVRR
ncbi:MAG: class I SAM-dependent methyltransferase [Gemmatimonadales bacterium]